MAYPNVLVMGYLEKSGQLTPEMRLKIEHAINVSYQRLLTFEAKGGGFDWYPGGSAKTMLTAYGVLELSDMNRVYPIDTRVIDRAAAVLMSRRRGGAWALDDSMHTWGGFGELAMTAYVTWALLEAGRVVDVDYIERKWSSADDAYVLALCANALVKAKSPQAKAALDRLEAEGRDGLWTTKRPSLCWSRGDGADVETTALAALALLRGGRDATKAFGQITRRKDPSGAWGSTQATILCIKSLMEAASGGTFAGDTSVSVRVNGRDVPIDPITRENSIVTQQVRLPVVEGDNVIELSAAGPTVPSYQIFGRYHLPWGETEPEPESPVDIDVVYDRTTLTRDEVLTMNVTLRYSGDATFMLIADLGVPPGFDVDTTPLEALRAAGKIDKFSATARQVTLYFGRVERGWTERMALPLRPRYAMKVKAPRCEAYEYYTPQSRAATAPATIEVRD